ncbi:MAG TPA: ABC transporter ATP-binding protein [Polyangiaceae bacterium]|jgi:iron complex transport system ATP-binding protein|nr:ABC transporter ATP-binding protein [Polyangiaceae bacterium]
MSAEALRAENVVVRFGAREALRGPSLTVAFGEVTAVVGPNASGKTTLLKALAGIVPYEGRVFYGSEDAATLTRAARARRVAYVPQKTELDAAQTVHEVVMQGRYAHHGFGAPSRLDGEAAERAMTEAAVTHLERRPFTTLSGGEQRRVLVARALATEAPTILLDEPTASLDVAHVLGIHELLRALAERGRGVLVVLHALDDARMQTDRTLLMSNGRIVAEGASTAIIVAEHVRDVYGVELVEAGAIGFRRPKGAA